MERLIAMLAEARERRIRRRYLKRYKTPLQAETARNYIEKGEFTWKMNGQDYIVTPRVSVDPEYASRQRPTPKKTKQKMNK